MFTFSLPILCLIGKQNGWQPIRDNKLNFIKSQFPLAKMEGTISPEFAEVMEAQLHEKEQLHASHPPLFEKVPLKNFALLLVSSH